MKLALHSIFFLLFLSMSSSSMYAQNEQSTSENLSSTVDFTDRQKIITATENFFIGDHTGSIKHKKLSMHENGAYRYVTKDGEYGEYKFDVNSDDSDTSYKEELLSVEIFATVALVRLRLAENSGGHHYKMLTLHKFGNDWKITTITWGTEITQ